MGLGLERPSHWVVIAVVALLLFGYKKLPDMARSAGRSMRIFKTEIKGMADDDDARSTATDGDERATKMTSTATADAAPAALPAPNGEVPVAQAAPPVTTASVAPHEAGSESAPPRPS